MDLLGLNEALERLERHAPEKAAIGQASLFCGTDHSSRRPQALGISSTTADRHWAYARAWIHAELPRTADSALPGHPSQYFRKFLGCFDLRFRIVCGDIVSGEHEEHAVIEQAQTEEALFLAAMQLPTAQNEWHTFKRRAATTKCCDGEFWNCWHPMMPRGVRSTFLHRASAMSSQSIARRSKNRAP